MKEPPVDDKKNANKKQTEGEMEEIDEDELYQQEKIFVSSLTPPVKPVAPEKKYYHVPFGSDKPCTSIKFPFEDQRRRHYNSILLQKIYNILVKVFLIYTSHCGSFSRSAYRIVFSV